MLTFLVQEGVITVGTLSGIFTAAMLNSLKNNVIDPFSYEFICKTNLEEHFLSNEQQNEKPPQTKINFKVFIKDFIIWLILMIILYLIWKYIIHPIKSENLP